MNTLILGLPRNGKGLFTAQQGIDELRLGERPIIGNFAWEKLPWRTDKHELRCGLLSYLQKTYGDDFNAKERVFRISDEATSRFYLYRALNRKTIKKLESSGEHLVGYRQVTAADGVLSDFELYLHRDYQLFVCDHEIRKDKNNRDVLVSFNPILLQHSGPHMNIADECWKFWPARGWQSTSECDVFYNAQHGKFGDDNFFVTHRHNDLDSVIVDRCQTSIVLTHHGKMRFGKFRRPDVYEAATYSGRPMPSKPPMHKSVFRLDAAGIGACYDTSAGVGVTGRGGADRGGRKTGLPFWLVPVLGCLAVLFIAWAIVHVPRYVMSFFMHKPPPPVVRHLAPAAQNSVQSFIQSGIVSSNLSAQQIQQLADTNLFCVGYCLGGSGIEPQAFMSDGSTVDSSDGLTMILKHTVVINGKVYPVRKQLQRPYTPSAVVIFPQPDASPPAPVNDAEVTYIGQSYFQRGSPPRLGGFNQMQRASPGGSQTGSYNQ